MPSLRRGWASSARLFAHTFNSLTNGLTTTVPEGPVDRNVDMLIGGQAVIEGVMMRSLNGYTVAVRQPDGGIALRKEALVTLGTRYPFLKIPVVRGTFVLIQAMILGIRSLNFAANVTATDEKDKKELSAWAIASSMGLALLMAIAFFVLAPLALTNLIRATLLPEMSNFTYNLIDGVIRAVFFFGYVISISFLEEIRRVFQYHGAEHKTVYTFEANEELTVENARRKSTLHPRCGTSFLMFVMAISIFVFSLIPATSPFVIKFGARILLMPLVAGLSYEVIRFSARHLTNRWCRMLITPGLWLQRITTKEPDEKQLEIAIVALREALLYDVVDTRQPAVA
jgi:uncharacterized protein YqhQ